MVCTHVLGTEVVFEHDGRAPKVRIARLTASRSARISMMRLDTNTDSFAARQTMSVGSACTLVDGGLTRFSDGLFVLIMPRLRPGCEVVRTPRG